MEYKFVQKWDEDIDISWQKKSRIELNKIIEEYNNWQINGFDKNKIQTLLAKIEYSKQTIGEQDGESGYWDELDEMETFINTYNNRPLWI